MKILDDRITCSSYVGYLNDEKGFQTIILDRDCFFKGLGNTLRTFIHKIGFNNNHLRPNRDAYLTVNFQNIIP